MGQKVTPTGFRLGITSKPQSQWFVDPRSGMMKKMYPPLILEDKFIRDFITQKFPRTAIAQILIYRTLDYIKIEIHTAQAKKLSYQSSNFNLSKKTLTTSNNSLNTKNDNSSTDNKEKSVENDYSNKKKYSSSSSNLKHLQQDLQIELAKYKKTLRMFSNWKHDRYLEKNPKINDQSQELPKLWSYEADSNFTNSKNTNFSGDPSIASFEDSPIAQHEENRQAVPESNRQTEFKSHSTTSSELEQHDNYDNELNFLEQTEKVTQHIGIIVKQLNQPFQYASIFAKYLVSQLEKRENSVKQALNRSLKLIQNYNIQGIKIKVSGRLNGVDMAEQQIISKGRIPLSTINANIDYYQDVAQTLYGTLGVKVFIFR